MSKPKNIWASDFFILKLIIAELTGNTLEDKAAGPLLQYKGMVPKLPQVRKLTVFGLVLALLGVVISFQLTSADELDDVTNELSQQQQQLSDLEERKEQLARDISSASASLSQVSAELSQAEEELSAIESELAKREATLKQWEEDRNFLIRVLYKQSRVSPVEVVFSSDNLVESTKNLQYYDDNLDLLKDRIGLLVDEIGVFQANKATARQLRDDLAALRDQYQYRLASSQRQFSSTSSQLASVKSSIQNLTAQQEQLILAKFAAGGGSETVGDSPPLSEQLPDPSFSPAYMVAAYGYPHRIGMSQYGAYGRAKKNQDYKSILAAYYKVSASSIQTYRVGGTIHVKGCSVGPPPWYPGGGGWSQSTCQSKGYKWYDATLSMETYIKGLGEMPLSWGSAAMEAYKAQAVAGRSYAWAYADGNGGTICPSTYCQVYLGYNKGSYWEQAVNATPNQVIVQGGAPLKAFYHSTAGGYTISTQQWTSYWNYIDGIKDFHSDGQAYEQVASAPWYHTGWGSRTGSGYNPWMTQEEFADIFNAILLCRKSNTQPYELASDCPYMQYLSPIDKGGWDMPTVRNNVSGVTPITSISAVVPTFPSGVPANTSTVLVYGSHGTYAFSARYFRDMFNLRSRGTLQIPTYRFDFTVKQ
ncbi:hypothetical protein GTO10_01970 [Candidatus Saccharibacteria bacterium]|nr:hypothetical protein [Candidatus Saccharibacteria bacterium]